jgi:hypothetical protein
MPDDKKYKGLQIDLENIPGWIDVFCSQKEYIVSKVNKHESKQSIDYEVVHNKGSFSFSLFVSNGNRYTFSYKRGSNQSDSKEFADFVIQRISKVNEPMDDNRGYSIHLSADNFAAFIDLLVDDDVQTFVYNDNEKNTQYSLKSIQYRDEIVIHYYKTTQNVFIQGKRLELFNKATDILAGSCEFVDVINAEIRYDKVNISSDKVIENMKLSLGKVYDFLSSAQKAIMSNAFKFYRIEMDSEDYSVFVQPMCRAMDGFFYKLFKKLEITIEDDEGELYGISHFFRSEKEKTNPLLLKEEFASIINNERIQHEFNRMYAWYHRNRHAYSHSTERDFTTAIIKDRKVADTLFEEAVDLYRTVYDTIVEEKRK